MADQSNASINLEERAEQDLAHLNQLHLQASKLHPQFWSEQYFANVTKSAEDTGEEIEAFKKAYTSEKTKAVFQRGTESRKANTLGIRPWCATDDPDWTRTPPQREDTDSASSGNEKK
ncbi:hypothetical protein B0T16DRAFT_390861 [Cercophora newfieldiana]|uniref:Uncharacterized protein n=1 Tax=Cercophora newfieldiana TaxID=92897 RepID=A0AA40CRF7_9PEZI|nr:hypothetical protein B0T16DRAFT_390861 [Cercophora newfieldiana]